MKEENLEAKDEIEVFGRLKLYKPKSKRITVTRGGHSVSINTALQFKKQRSERIFRPVPFSHSFWREFKHLFPNYDNGQHHGEDFRLPSGLSNFIDSIIFKYSEVHDSRLLKKRRKFGYRLAKDFLTRDLISGIDISEENKIDYCKSFIEYGFFLRTVHGEKANPIRMRDFVECVNGGTRLDPEKLCKIALESEYEFREAMMEKKHGGYTKNNLVQFDRFIMYQTIPYSNKEDMEKVKKRIAGAKTTLEEAILKYGIRDSNMETYLKLALQHLEWGITQASNIILKHVDEKLHIYSSEEEKERAMRIVENKKLFLLCDVFDEVGIKENTVKFKVLNVEDALPIVTKREGIFGYFVAEEGLTRIMEYLDQNRAVNYKLLRGK